MDESTRRAINELDGRMPRDLVGRAAGPSAPSGGGRLDYQGFLCQILPGFTLSGGEFPLDGDGLYCGYWIDELDSLGRAFSPSHTRTAAGVYIPTVAVSSWSNGQAFFPPWMPNAPGASYVIGGWRAWPFLNGEGDLAWAVDVPPAAAEGIVTSNSAGVPTAFRFGGEPGTRTLYYTAGGAGGYSNGDKIVVMPFWGSEYGTMNIYWLKLGN